MGVTDPAPAALAEGDVVYGVLIVERFVEVDQFMDVQFADLAQTGAAWTTARGVVERESVGIANERLTDAGEQQSQ